MNESLIHLRKIVGQGSWGYHPAGPCSTEPVAFACLALCANGFADDALRLANWLAEIQSSTGSVGVTEDQAEPEWPTSLAMLAWHACDHGLADPLFSEVGDRALDWALHTKGKAALQQSHIGHDTTLLGWSWAADTHSWLEPTCLFVLALKAIGLGGHPRAREGVRLIIDRQLENGGCNFGNTRVLGQATLPHVQSTGLAMLSIADERTTDPRIERSLVYLENALIHRTATASLSFALLGLAAHHRRPANTMEILHRALADEVARGPSCYKLALLALAGSDTLIGLPSVGSHKMASSINSRSSQTVP